MSEAFPQRRPDAEAQREVAAALAARRELGPEFEDHIAAGLAERVEQLVAYRVADQRQQVSTAQEEVKAEASARTNRFVLGIISLGAGVPITAISASQAELPGLLVAWAGIIGVNVAHALGSRPRR